MKAQNHQALYLLKFNFTLKYIPDVKIGEISRLSKRLNQKIEVENNNNQILIKNHWIYNLVKVVIEKPEVDILEKIKITRGKNKEVIKVVEKIKKAGVKVLQEDGWQIKGNLVLKEEKMYMLKNKELRVEIIQLHHNVPVVRHKGR